MTRMPDLVTPARTSPARLPRAFAIAAVIALAAVVLLAGLGTHRVYYAYVRRGVEMDANRLADSLVRDAQELGLRGAGVPATEAGRAALDARLRDDLRALGFVEITMFDRNGTATHSTASRAAPPIRGALERTAAGRSVSHIVEHPAETGSLDALVAYVPLREGRRVFGSLRVVSDVRPARAEFNRLLAVSTGLVVIVLGTVFGGLFLLVRTAARQVEAAQRELETMAVTDAVTGLANRRYLMARAAEECARIPRQRGRDPAKAGVGFIMADLDGFKTVNDTQGHLAGDEILRSVAERIRRVTRRYDVVGRYGGDEFLVVVPGTDFDETGSVAERLWQIVREEPFTIAGASLPMTVSVGFTCADGDDVNAALKRADEALYRAKHGGRDRVVPL